MFIDGLLLPSKDLQAESNVNIGNAGQTGKLTYAYKRSPAIMIMTNFRGLQIKIRAGKSGDRLRK